MKPIIGIDLDDVLWDLLTAWLQRYNEVACDHVKPEDIKTWDIARYINRGTPEMLFYILEQSDFWETVKPREGAQEYLEKLVDDDCKIYIVTASRYTTIKHKMNRFFNLFPFINEEQVIMIHDKQVLDIDVLVDDNIENLKGANYKKLLFDTVHNQGGDIERIGGTRVHNWAQIYEYITQEYY